MSSILKKTEGVLDFKLNSTTSTITVKFEDSKIDLEKIVKKIRKGKFPVRKKTEVTVPKVR
ncbi:MAG: cation transporter [Deltaproteobacteria bacterium]|nr:cation transporter [Deltaproteobacteria bacterium]